MQWFFVDAETDGLYGRFLSIAAMVTDENGSETDHFYGSVKCNENDIESKWVIEHVLPFLSQADHIFEREEEMLDEFWIFWRKHKEESKCVAYVPYPVESRLFQTCVLKDRDAREFEGPFPIYDLATLLDICGYSFDADVGALSGLDLIIHDAMNDVRIMSAVWLQLYTKAHNGKISQGTI